MNWNNVDSIAAVEQAARAALDPATWSYLSGGAETDGTISANAAAFAQLRLVPRLRTTTAASVDLTSSLFGQALAMPVLLAPTSPQRLFCAQAELATARAARQAGTISIVSADSHYPYPEIHGASGQTSWFQLYAYGSRYDIECLLDLAGNAGAKALVVTMDASYPARRLTMKRADFTMPSHVEFGTLRAAGIDTTSASKEGRLQRVPLTWTDLAWIRERQTGPMLVKGVLSAEDACRCVDLGMDGIIVSNHGGRQLDSAIPSLEALGPIAAQVGGRCAILLDSGVRSGIDVIKALATGADAVCLGRPYLWGLAADGEQGVATVVDLIRQQMEDTLLQMGASTLADIRRQPASPALRRLPTSVSAENPTKARA